jgi:hypothetical protein
VLNRGRIERRRFVTFPVVVIHFAQLLMMLLLPHFLYLRPIKQFHPTTSAPTPLSLL